MIGASIGIILVCWIILGNAFTIYGLGLYNEIIIMSLVDFQALNKN